MFLVRVFLREQVHSRLYGIFLVGFIDSTYLPTKYHENGSITKRPMKYEDI